MSRTVVIGGGFSGLAAAALLANDGHEVTLVEQTEAVGGRASTFSERGFVFDRGPSWFLMKEVFDHFYALMGTSTEAELSLGRLDPAYRVHRFGEAETLEVSGDLAVTAQRFEVREPGSAAVLGDYLDSAKRVTELAESALLWNRFDDPRNLLRRDLMRAAPSMLPLLGTSLHRHVRRRFRDPLLRQALSYPAVFLGTRPERAPALYHLMSAFDLEQGVFYPSGGFGAVVQSIERLARAAGATLLTSTPAVRILLDGRRRVTGVRVREGGVERIIEADRVVVACDHGSALPALLPGLSRRARRRLNAQDPGPGAVLAYLGVRGRLEGAAHHNLVFTPRWKRNFDAVFKARAIPDPASFYACVPSRTDPLVAPEGDENLFILIPVGADTALGTGGSDGTGHPDVEAAVEAAIAELARAWSIPDLSERVYVRRTVGPADLEREFGAWKGSALGPAHTLRQSAFLRGSVRSREATGLYTIGGSSVPGIGVPMCLISAEILLKYARGDRSAGPLPEPSA